MGKWEMVWLGDVCNFINGDRGVNYPSAKDFCESGIPFINAGHLENDAVTFDSMNYISELKYSQLGSGKVLNGDLLYCLRGSLGKQAVVRGIENGAIASSLVIIRPHNINIDYLHYCMKSREVYEQQLKANNGSSQPNLSAASVKKYIIPLPSLPVQQKIADILDRANALIEKRKEQIEKLDLLVKSQFIEMFGDPVTNPMEWEFSKVNDTCSTIVDCPHSTPNYLQIDTGFMCMRTSILKPNQISWKRIEYISNEQYIERTKRYIPRMNDIVYSREGAILGIAAIIDMDYQVALGQRMMLLSANLEICNPKYLCYMMNSPYIVNQVKGRISGSASPHINVADVKAFSIPIPPLALQAQFADFVERVEAQKTQLKKSLALLELNYKSLMQKCFKGELLNG